jgi:UDP-glucose 4-epimerase
MKKVVVTGGSGRLGQFVIRELLAHGYQVLSLDRVSPREKLCPTWIADLRHSGDLFEALNGAYGVIHLGAYQAPNLAPDTETLGNNVSATYNVLRVAADTHTDRVVIASSTAAFGFIYAKRLWAPEYLPLDEKHPSLPQDSYQGAMAQSANARQRILDLYRRARCGDHLPVGAGSQVHRASGVYRSGAEQLHDSTDGGVDQEIPAARCSDKKSCRLALELCEFDQSSAHSRI